MRLPFSSNDHQFQLGFGSVNHSSSGDDSSIFVDDWLVKRRRMVFFHNVQYAEGSRSGCRGQVYVRMLWAGWLESADCSRNLPQTVVKSARETAFLNRRHSFRFRSSVSDMRGSAAKMTIKYWSLTLDSCSFGMLSWICMLNNEVDSHRVVSQLVVAHITMRLYGIVVREPGNPSSRLRYSMDVE